MLLSDKRILEELEHGNIVIEPFDLRQLSWPIPRRSLEAITATWRKCIHAAQWHGRACQYAVVRVLAMLAISAAGQWKSATTRKPPSWYPLASVFASSPLSMSVRRLKSIAENTAKQTINGPRRICCPNHTLTGITMSTVQTGEAECEQGTFDLIRRT